MGGPKDINGTELRIGDPCEFWDDVSQETYLDRFIGMAPSDQTIYCAKDNGAWKYCRKLNIIEIPNLPFKKGDLIEVSDCENFSGLTFKLPFDHYDPQSNRPYVMDDYGHYKYARLIKKQVDLEHVGRKVLVGDIEDQIIYPLYLMGILPDSYSFKYVCVSKVAEPIYEKTGIATNLSTWRFAKPTD